MDKKQPPDPGNRDLDTSTTDDKINAFDEVADSFRAGIQPAIFLSHSFLQKHPILLEEGCLTVNWDQIPGLYLRTDKLLTVSVTDKQWEKWGQSGGWTAWEPDTQPQNFFPNVAMVVCKGAFYDAQDPMTQTKVGHFISIAWVPDCILLSSSGKHSTIILMPPPPSDLSGCTMVMHYSQMSTSSFTGNISPLWACKTRQYSLVRPMSLWVAI